MGKVTAKIKSFFSSRKPIPRDEAEDLAGWVNEGGSYHPDGPPPVIEDGDPGDTGDTKD